MNRLAEPLRVIALIKNGEQYVFHFDAAGRDETLRTLGRFAANPDLSFSWYDAAVVSRKIRTEAKATA